MFLLNDVNELYDHFSEKVYATGILDKKTKELIAVACSVMASVAELMMVTVLRVGLAT